MNRRCSRTGATLIDVATGSMLMAVLLIPSVHLIGKSRSSNHRLETRDAILYEADQLLETTKVSLAEPAAFAAVFGTPLDRAAPIASGDVPHLVGRVRVAADATVAPAELLTILVDLWQDQNQNGRLDTGEPSQSLRTQWAAP